MAGRSKRQTQWAWCQASERLLFNINNKIKCPKGKGVQNKHGIWCPCHAARFVKEGQCSRRNCSTRAPFSGPGREGWLLRLATLSSFGPRRFQGLYGPASRTDQPYSGCGSRPDRRSGMLTALAAWDPSTLPSWIHEDASVHARGGDRSLEERRPRHLTAVVMRLHSYQVCLITPDMCVSYQA